MSQNIGTLVTSTLRPNDSQDPISIVYTNEARGGHHVYSSISNMYNIIQDRRDWGMLVTIYNDATASNNKTYQLKYNYYSTNLNDNANWIIYTPNSTSNGEWVNSVISRTTSIPFVINTGDRYLIYGATGGTATSTSQNTWNGHNDCIAEYDSSIPTWNFTIPSNGMTVRVDNEKSSLYRFDGSYSYGGTWSKEYLNQVYFITATSSNGIDYTAGANIFTYSKPSVFYINFATSSVGASASLNINNLGKIIIKKVTSNSLYDIASGDINISVKYQLIYDGTYFQVQLPAAVNIIGPAEFGNTYSNGVYSDFTVNTQIGTPIDRFNQLLDKLVPPSAPTLSSINAFSATYAVGRLSFPSVSVSNFKSATGSPYGNIGLDGLWSLSATADGGIYRLGIYSGVNGNQYNVDLYGVLNYNKPSNNTTPVESYTNSSFGDGTTGVLYMNINGFTVSTISFTNSYLAVDATSNMSIPGLSVSAATSSKFPNGGTYDFHFNRTGMWYIPKSALLGTYSYNASIGLTANSYGITRGYNYMTINHYKGSNNILNKIEFIVDDDNSSVSVTNPNGGIFNNFTFSAIKKISGISYYSSVYLQYMVDVNNIYSNVYSNRSDAIYISNCTPTGVGYPAPVLSTYTASIPTYSTANFSSLPYIVNYIYDPSFANFRRINDAIAVYTSKVYKPLLPVLNTTPANGASASLFGIVFDSVNSNSTNLYEDFVAESYRLKTSGTPFNTVFSVISNTWSSSTYLQSDSGLQIFNDKLQYPTINFSNIGNGDANANYSNSNTNYSGLTGSRTYYRYFLDTTINSSQFSIAIIGTGSLINSTLTPSINSNEFNINIKLPSQTGWLDISKSYNNSTYTGSDNDGIYNSSGIIGVPGVPNGIAINLDGTPFALNIGTDNTSISSGYIVLRVIAPQGWTGNLDSIEIKYY